MPDFTWDDDDSRAVTTKLTDETVPNRLAITAPQVITHPDHLTRALLIDPHPAGTWETWMFPYASLILDNEMMEAAASAKERPRFLSLKPGDTLKDVAEALHDVRLLYRDEYQAALSEGLNNVLPDLIGTWHGQQFYENYSLKYSNTSHSYTAYLFVYSEGRTAVTTINVPHIWADMAEFEDPDTNPAEWGGKKLSSNVPQAFRHYLAHRSS
jgi:hypothetical protein